jgi:CDP-4-dehydro-6-deoxyglucose reductase
MTYRVRLLPRGREFEAMPQESLLAAALRAGISPEYGCGNGTCGKCEARVVSGTVAAVQTHDFPLSAADRQNGHVLLCCVCAGSDLEIEAATADSIADIPRQEIPTRVAKLDKLAEDVVALHLRTPRSRTLRFLAGQHVRLEIDGIPARHKSIASCPCDGMHLEFHIRHAPMDPFADHVFTRLRSAHDVRVIGPWGAFTWHEGSDRPVILLAYETGFAAIRSLIEQALNVEFAHPMHLYWLVRNPTGHYLDGYCRSLADTLEQFRYTPLVATNTDTPQAAVTPAQSDVLFAARRILADHPDIAQAELYASGPVATMTAAAQLLQQHGLPPEKLHVDDPPRL